MTATLNRARPVDDFAIKPISVKKLIDDNPRLQPVVIDGLLRRGETANVIASAKTGKSFLAGQLAWCVATGTPWLGHDVMKGRVLVIDNELHPATLADRLHRISKAMNVSYATCGDFLDVVSMRGLGSDIHSFGSKLAWIKSGDYQLVVIDALYRTLPSGTSENDNAAMMAVYNQLDEYARRWDSAIAVVHHSSKGYQGDKLITDVGSGAGSISRAADTHIAIRPHSDAELSVLEAVTRSFKSPDPISIRFGWPLWSVDSTEPSIKQNGTKADKQKRNDDEADKLLRKELCADEWLSESQLVRRTGMGPSRVPRAIKRALDAGEIIVTKVKRYGRELDVYKLAATETATP